jgi:hypothetical protein
MIMRVLFLSLLFQSKVEDLYMQRLMIKKTAVLNWQTRNLEITDIKV